MCHWENSVGCQSVLILLLPLKLSSHEKPVTGARVHQRIVHLVLGSLPFIFKVLALNLPENLWHRNSISAI